MNHSQDFLEQIAQRAGIRNTTYAIAKHMGDRYGWSRTSIINYRKGTTAPDDRKALDIAQELGLEPMYVIACVQADRATTDQLRTVWERMAERVRQSAAALAAVILSGAILAGGGIESARASAAYDADRDLAPTDQIYIMRILRAAIRRLLEALEASAEDGLAAA